jgi:alkylated DNA repair dioxygenase AlkB
MQGSLFGGGAPTFDPGFVSALDRARAGVRRVELSGGAWIEYHPGWLDGHQRVYEELAGSAPWQSQRRQMYEREVEVPRLVARAPEAGPLASLLRQLSRALSQRYSLDLRCARPGPLGAMGALRRISLAHYRDGRDSVAFHGDKLGRLVDNSVVATISVGAPRRFLLKPRAGGPSLAFELGWGDLFVMGGTCQRTWQHAVPKRAHADPRISIMFRPVVPESI